MQAGHLGEGDYEWGCLGRGLDGQRRTELKGRDVQGRVTTATPFRSTMEQGKEPSSSSTVDGARGPGSRAKAALLRGVFQLV